MPSHSSFFFLLLLTTAAPAAPLTFSATGCGPYAPKEEPLLEKYLDLVAKDGKSAFLLHLGDIVHGTKKDWPEEQFAKVATILRASKTPVFIVPGDNEWNDQDDPDQAWSFWVKHFMNFEKHFPDAPKVQRQRERPENLAWVQNGVLMVGINLVGGRVHDKKEWARRMDENGDWVRRQLKENGEAARAMVVFAQATPLKDHEPFVRQLADAAKTWGKPVLYLHADGHVWQVESPWRAPNLVRVQTEQLSKNPPVLVTVSEDPAAPFHFDRRDGKAPIVVRIGKK